MSPKRVLVVDDSYRVVETARRALSAEGYEVMIAQSGEEALRVLRQQGLPHVALVDLKMPPRMSGYVFCKEVHQFTDLPVIMLANNRDEVNELTGWHFYIQEYVVKPLDEEKLVEEVSRVIRRTGAFMYPLAPVMDIDDRLQIDLVRRMAIVDGKSVILTPLEAKFLYILMKNAGTTMDTSYLLRRIWPRDKASDDRLHAHVYRLRKKIEVNPKEPTYIVSEWARGYSFPAPQPAISE